MLNQGRTTITRPDPPVPCTRCGRPTTKHVTKNHKGFIEKSMWWCDHCVFGVNTGGPKSIGTMSKPAGLIPLPEQEAICKHMANWRNGHLIVEAGAGTGKSTTMVGGVARMSHRGTPMVVLSFNAHIEEEMRKKLNMHSCEDVHSKTFNGMGYGVLLSRYPNIKLRRRKLGWTVREVVGDTVKWETRQWVEKAVGLAKAYYLDLGDTDKLLWALERHKFKLPATKKTRDKHVSAVWRVLEMGLADTEGCDYDDQIYMPLKLGLRFPKYRMVLVDEFQDTNAVQWEMLKAIGRPDCRYMIVGDKNQACYGFRGADIEAMDRVELDLAMSDLGVTILPLSVTLRCPVSAVRAANSIVPSLRHLPDAPFGVVGTKSKAQFMAQAKPGDLVMCRTNSPLIEYALALISIGKKVVVRGRDIGDGLTQLIERLAPTSIQELADLAENWYKIQKADLNFLTQQEEIQVIEDKYRPLVVLMHGCPTLDALYARIEDVFSNFESDGAPRDAVIFASIHRAKGLEAEQVWVLCPELIPHPKSTEDWEIEQERHLAYIAITRAKFNRFDPNTGQTWFVDGTVPLIYGSKYMRNSEPHNPEPLELD
jgi:DNA helicase-2/ATP-dependent DNA helicase PcrA